MKIFKKIKKENNLRYIYFFGIKILSYRKTHIRYYIKKYIKAKDPLFFNKCKSKKKEFHIDVVIPTTTKDIHKLEKVIPSLNNITHHIDNIFIVSPKSEYVVEFCKQYKTTFIDENSVLPITLQEIKYKPQGISREGWIFQQLLKLNIDTFCKNEYILVADSDTLFNKKQYFIKKEKMVFDCSDEFHLPYFDTLKKLLPIKKRFPLSFVAHHMLFKKSYLKEMKNEIEKTQNKPWLNAILDNLHPDETSSFSEYETYGNWMYQNHKKDMLLREWYNLSTTTKNFETISKSTLNKFKTISMHSYNEE